LARNEFVRLAMSHMFGGDASESGGGPASELPEDYKKFALAAAEAMRRSGILPARATESGGEKRTAVAGSVAATDEETALAAAEIGKKRIERVKEQ